jgi:iron complex transport system ATP-binding protein
MKDKYFELSNLSVGYNKKTLINDICLDIKKGEIVTLIGPNGAGKSTILKSITRQLEIIGGRVFIEAGDLMKISFKDLSKKMAVVLTERLKTELLTCHDIVATGRYPYTGRLGILSHEDEDKVDAALAMMNALDLGNKDFNAISDGQRQRVLMARAICQEPEIIILDEPTSFLDIHYKLELLSILARMAKQSGITIIMTLHEIDLAQKVSDKIVCVSDDLVVHYGAPSEIFDEEVIRKLYGIDNGFYDPLFGSIELAKPQGDKPEVFVISSSGTGIPVFRELQKVNTPFAAGILYTNDVDYRLARLLSCEVVSEEPFEGISDRAFGRAKELVDLCDRVIYTGFRIGTSNGRIKDIIEYARESGKLETVTDSMENSS